MKRHNVHYWIGNGSSARDDNCRVSSDHHGLDHVIKDCNCRYCRSRGGAPMCATLDCRTQFLESLTQLNMVVCYSGDLL